MVSKFVTESSQVVQFYDLWDHIGIKYTKTRYIHYCIVTYMLKEQMHFTYKIFKQILHSMGIKK